MPPKQIEPLIDPEPPKTENRYTYYLLKEMNSPPVSTPNAIRWRAYPRPRFLRQGDPHDTRIVYGFIEYEEKITWADLKKYNMLPFDYAESLLYDLWQAYGGDKDKLLKETKQFLEVIKDDPDLARIQLVSELVGRGWTLPKMTAALEAIEA